MPRSAVRVEAVSPRVAALAVRVDDAKAQQSRHLADIAVPSSKQQRKRLDEYSVQARYALATIYDRATSGSCRHPRTRAQATAVSRARLAADRASPVPLAGRPAGAARRRRRSRT